MNQQVHNKLVSFIWSVADDCLRDVYVRGKYRDVILPFVVLRRIDALLEPTKNEVLDYLEEIKEDGENALSLDYYTEELKSIAKFPFYNTSPWTLERLKSTFTNSTQKIIANFKEYFNGFSDNVKIIIQKFDLFQEVEKMANKDILLAVLEKFTSPNINLTPFEKLDPQGNILPPLSNLGMGYVFEELIRKFNEENNEEAGEHFTPREVIQLMTTLVFDPIKNNIPFDFTIYDPACGSGGMLTESFNYLYEQQYIDNHIVGLFGTEINDETYAIAISDMMIKGKDPENIVSGSTLAQDCFPNKKFNFMLSNPPYGKSWVNDAKSIKDGNNIIDKRFQVILKDYFGNADLVDATPRSSDGQLLFLMDMVHRMKSTHEQKVGARIASVHNGSALFTGDAGSGESNIRRYIIENDLLDAIIQLPNNFFYNTGITTYIWLLSNNKPQERKGKVQLIDAANLYRKLRKNLGNKNAEFAPEHIDLIKQAYLELWHTVPTQYSDQLNVKVFNNKDFGYYKVNIERPKRLAVQFTTQAIEDLRFDKSLFKPMQALFFEKGDMVFVNDLSPELDDIIKMNDSQNWGLNKKDLAKLIATDTWQKPYALYQKAMQLAQHFGEAIYMDYNLFIKDFDAYIKAEKIDLSATEKKTLLNAITTYNDKAAKVIKKIEKLSTEKVQALCQRYNCQPADLPAFGYFPADKKGEYIIYETESDLRDSEQIPLAQAILHYFAQEVQPHVPEAWINLDSVKIGYEISFNKYFYKHTPLRPLAQIKDALLKLEEEADGLLTQILNF